VEVVLAIVLLAAVAAFVAVPLRGGVRSGPDRVELELADLEARKQAKYREIRDTELDRAAGKIEDSDFDRQDAELRADAIGILKRIDELERKRKRERARHDPGEASPPAGPSI
jgi:hypothetical protein